jgi:hypothetical protein
MWQREKSQLANADLAVLQTEKKKKKKEKTHTHGKTQLIQTSVQFSQQFKTGIYFGTL